MKRMSFVLALIFTFALPAWAASTSQPEHMSKKQLATLIAAARTPAEHQRIADYYRAQSSEFLAEANHHAAMAAAFRANSAINNQKSAWGTVNHCEYLAQSLKAKAAQAAALAVEHERMAVAAEQK